MNLFINAVSQFGSLILFDNQRNIVAQHDIEILGNESSKLISYIDAFLTSFDYCYDDLENLVVVHGPGSFTGIRTIVLAVNTINYICDAFITPLSFFDLFSDYPIIKNSSKRDLFVKYELNGIISIINNDDFLEYFNREKIQNIYGDIGNNNLSENIKNITTDIDYVYIIDNIVFEKNKMIEPLYIKKPSIS